MTQGSPGRFITLEGGEGVGKSTQLARLAVALRLRGVDVVTTREPGGSAGAEMIRKLLLEGPEERWGGRAEALLFAAARADHVDKIIRPAIAGGKWVLSDRFVDSSLAYQGAAGELGVDAVRSINQFAIGRQMPDRTLVLVLTDGNSRARTRDGDATDRIGGRDGAYHRLVTRAFEEIARDEPDRVCLIDASGSAEEVGKRLLEALGDLL